jgi:serine/threonine protein phosphatase 1
MHPDHPNADAGEVMTEPRHVYAVGDIHGRIDLLEPLYAALRADAESLGQDPPGLVFLGDYIDRGPASDKVIEFVISIPETQFEVTPLLGNHEAVMLAFLDDPRIGPDWRRHGGQQTLEAYRVPPPEDESGWRDTAEALSVALPMEHLSFLYSLRRTYEWGDYFFCHAGVHPERALSDQSEEDLLWIREPFLSQQAPLAKVIVHGHTIRDAIHSDAVRIGLDTGAYRSGVLSAVRLDRAGPKRTFFTATTDGVTRWVDDGAGGATPITAQPPAPAAPVRPPADPLRTRLRMLAHRIGDLAEQPWPETARAEALRTLDTLERDWRALDGLRGSHNDAPASGPPGRTPAEVPPILDWLESVGVSLRLVLPSRLSDPALRTARVRGVIAASIAARSRSKRGPVRFTATGVTSAARSVGA